MSRLLYKCEWISDLESTYTDLKELDVEDNNLHVIAKKQGKLLRRGLNAANFWYKTDVLHGAKKGALIGLATSILAVIAIIYADIFNANYGTLGISFTVLVFTAFGIWIGGFMGIQSKNHKLKRFYHLVEEGKYLLLIDLEKGNAEQIKRAIKSKHPTLTLLSEEVETVIPFKFMETSH